MNLLKRMVESPVFYALMGLVAFLSDPLGIRGLFWLAPECMAVSLVFLIIRWKDIGRISVVATVSLLLIIAILAIPNW